MRVVMLEEHFTLPELRDQISRSAAEARGWSPLLVDQLLDMLLIADGGERRLAEMDDAEITMQILSVVSPGADLLDGVSAVSFAREANDRLAEMIARHPARFGGFAQLPMSDPDAAATELQRASRKLKLSGVMVHGLSVLGFAHPTRISHPSHVINILLASYFSAHRQCVGRPQLAVSRLGVSDPKWEDADFPLAILWRASALWCNHDMSFAQCFG